MKRNALGLELDPYLISNLKRDFLYSTQYIGNLMEFRPNISAAPVGRRKKECHSKFFT